MDLDQSFDDYVADVVSYNELKASQSVARCMLAARLNKAKAELATQQREQKNELKRKFDLERQELEARLKAEWSDWSSKKNNFRKMSNSKSQHKTRGKKRLRLDSESSSDTLPDLLIDTDVNDSNECSVLLVEQTNNSSLKPQRTKTTTTTTTSTSRSTTSTTTTTATSPANKSSGNSNKLDDSCGKWSSEKFKNVKFYRTLEELLDNIE